MHDNSKEAELALLYGGLPKDQFLTELRVAKSEIAESANGLRLQVLLVMGFMSIGLSIVQLVVLYMIARAVELPVLK